MRRVPPFGREHASLHLGRREGGVLHADALIRRQQMNSARHGVYASEQPVEEGNEIYSLRGLVTETNRRESIHVPLFIC